jgi:predicted GNAT family acetyltransferase
MSRLSHAGLDRPVWTALTTRQAHLGHGNALARRYDPEVAPFAALESDSSAAFHALHQLLQPDEQVSLLSVAPLTPVDALRMTQHGTLLQMVATHREAEAEAGAGAGSTGQQEVIRLAVADVHDMLDLVGRTQPGPFRERTIEMGRYFGIRDQGRLVAMAGERMCFDGYVEISAVCVDEAWRGKGLAARLMRVVHKEIAQRGMTPFLHVFADNRSAIGLYECLGFEVRRTFHVTRVRQAEAVLDASGSI